MKSNSEVCLKIRYYDPNWYIRLFNAEMLLFDNIIGRFDFKRNVAEDEPSAYKCMV